MSISIVATAGSASANSFVTEAEAIAYAALRLNLPSGWATVSGSTCTENEKKALIEATRDLSRLVYGGTRTTSVQALSWPRSYALDPDTAVDHQIDVYAGLPFYDSATVPLRIKEATYELAFEHLRADITVADTGFGVVREKVDVLETEWTPGLRLTGLARFPRVLALVSPLLGSTSLEAVRS
jgi:hypothetical protein